MRVSQSDFGLRSDQKRWSNRPQLLARRAAQRTSPRAKREPGSLPVMNSHGTKNSAEPSKVTQESSLSQACAKLNVSLVILSCTRRVLDVPPPAKPSSPCPAMLTFHCAAQAEHTAADYYFDSYAHFGESEPQIALIWCWGCMHCIGGESRCRS